MDNVGSVTNYGQGFNTNINRFVPGGYVVGAFANQRSFVRTVTPGDPDRRPIQAAINDASRLGGGAIYLTPGTYMTTNKILMKSNVSLIGANQSNTVIDFGGTDTAYLAGTLTDNVVLRGITFKGFDDSGADSASVRFSSSNFVTIEECNFGNPITSFDLAGDILNSACGNFTVRNCRSGTPGVSSGGFFYYSTAVQQSNYVGNNYIAGHNVAFYGGAAVNDTVFIGNTIEGNTSYVFKGNFNNSQILSNHISYPEGTQVDSIGSFFATSAMVIMGNNITMGTGGLFDFPSLIQSRIIGNYITANKAGTCLMNFRAVASNNIITGNFIDAGAAANQEGIKFSGTSSGNIVNGNVIFSNSSGTGYAVNISDSTSDFNIVTNNYLIGQTGGFNNASSNSIGTNNLTN